ncbi:integrase [Friedmanniella endophytica]|uniref:Integrase n=1 Tax=Microlunatus kandeliicorticis TaxID=1759536 RepID=A0A7W3IUM5_9ACTN|nr:integrase [Microlunatus kandeliicorticis]
MHDRGSAVPKPDRPRKAREPFGRIRKLPSGRYQAAYIGPDTALHKASSTFDTLMDARGWVHGERRLIDAGTWVAPARRNSTARPATLADYAWPWLTERELKPRTRDLYRRLLDHHVLPQLGALPLADISPVTVRRWHSDLDPSPTAKAHSYALLRTILGTAVTDGLIPVNPCTIRGAGTTKRQHKIKPATLGELEALVEALPDRYGALVMLASWCALRFGELTELRRKDLDLAAGRLHVRRGVTFVAGQAVIGPPKSEAGIRDVSIPPHLLPMLTDHLDRFCAADPDALVFPAATTGAHLGHGTFFKTWDAARKAACRPDLRFHDLRHTGAVLAAQTGATLAELMLRLGHSTPAMAIRYQHAAQDRDAEIAQRLSAMVSGGA